MPVYPLDRDKTWLLPPSLDELIAPDHPARYVAAFVDGLEQSIWSEMEINLEGNPLGAPSYHPKVMLAVWLYGFMTGTRSSRKLEAACRDQMPYLWLTGWQQPDHNSLWRFYKVHRQCMRSLFQRTVRTAVSLGLVDMAIQAVDGTKIAASAAKKRTYDRAQLEALLEKTQAAINKLEEVNEAASDSPPAHLPQQLADKVRLASQVKQAMEELAKEDKKRINLTDRDAALLKTSQQSSIAGYNMEAMVCQVKPAEDDIDQSAGSRIITAIDVTAQQNDISALIPMLVESEQTTGRQADILLADAGFHSGANLGACEERRQVVVMSEPHVKDLDKPFHKDRFTYDGSTDSYTCPMGQSLTFHHLGKHRNMPVRWYYASGAVCRNCPAIGMCTKDKRNGRRLEIGAYEDVLRRHRVWMATEQAKGLYRKRKQIPELVFGIIKEQMAARRFLLRGLAKVRSEGVLLATAFNLRSLCKVWKKAGSAGPQQVRPAARISLARTSTGLQIRHQVGGSVSAQPA